MGGNAVHVSWAEVRMRRSLELGRCRNDPCLPRPTPGGEAGQGWDKRSRWRFAGDINSGSLETRQRECAPKHEGPADVADASAQTLGALRNDVLGPTSRLPPGGGLLVLWLVSCGAAAMPCRQAPFKDLWGRKLDSQGRKEVVVMAGWG